MKEAFEAARRLRRCCRARDLTTGRRLHAELFRIGLDVDTVVGNLLVQLYGACGCIDEALSAYHRICQRNVFSDNILMTSLAQNGRAAEARSLFFDGMKQRNEVSWTILLSSCAQDGRPDGAVEVFRRMPMTSAFSCNAMVSVYAQNGNLDEAWTLFAGMPYRDVSCWNATVNMFCKSKRVVEAETVYSKMPFWDVVSSTNLLVAFTQEGHLEKSEKLFDSMPERSVISWNAMMAAYGSQGCVDHVWKVFLDMVQRSASSWNTLLQAIARHGDQEAAQSVLDKMPMHDNVSLVAACEVIANPVVLMPHLSSINSWNALLRAYSRAGDSEQVRVLFTLMPYRDAISFTTVFSTLAYVGCLSEAVNLFLTMPSRDLISWSALIAVYTQHGQIDSARDLFGRMPGWDVVSCNAVLAAYLTRCSRDDLQAVKDIFISMPHREESTWNLVLGGYARSQNLELAKDLFNKVPCSDVFQWNSLMQGYVDACSNHLAWELFERIPEPSPSSYTILLPALPGSRHLELLARLDMHGTVASDLSVYGSFLDAFGRQGSTLSNGEKQAALLIAEALSWFDSDSDDRTWAALLSMFGRCGHLEQACCIFEDLCRPSTLLWTALLMAYSQNGYTQEALCCFRTMMLDGCKPDKVTLVATLDACTVDCRESDVAIRLAATELCVDESTDAMLGNSLVVMYGRWGQPYKAKEVFDRMHEPGTVPWTSMISAYSRSGHMLLAMITFAKMDFAGVPADNVTFAAALEACTTVEQVKAVHEELSPSSCYSSTLLTALVTTYARCGSARAAKMAFDDVRKKAPASSIAWTALVSAYAQNGHFDEALASFQEMQNQGLDFEGVTVLSILAACSHTGVIKHGLDAFLSMQRDYGLRPTLEHYLCMVDLLCRAGNLEQAEALLNTMPYEPQSLGWMTLLAACKNAGSVDRGQRAASQVLLQDTKSSVYVLLSGIYATSRTSAQGAS